MRLTRLSVDRLVSPFRYWARAMHVMIRVQIPRTRAWEECEFMKAQGRLRILAEHKSIGDRSDYQPCWRIIMCEGPAS